MWGWRRVLLLILLAAAVSFAGVSGWLFFHSTQTSGQAAAVQAAGSIIVSIALVVVTWGLMSETSDLAAHTKTLADVTEAEKRRHRADFECRVKQVRTTTAQQQPEIQFEVRNKGHLDSAVEEAYVMLHRTTEGGGEETYDMVPSDSIIKDVGSWADPGEKRNLLVPSGDLRDFKARFDRDQLDLAEASRATFAAQPVIGESGRAPQDVLSGLNLE